jgi:hypothetical protein
MGLRNPFLSLELEPLKNLPGTGLHACPARPMFEYRSRFLSHESQDSFPAGPVQLLSTFDVPDSLKDVQMKEFLKWRMRSLCFLYRYLDSGRPYYSEFLLTVEREADPHSNGRLILAGQALLEDLDEGFLLFDKEML